MSHTKAAGKARQGTPRKGRRLGIKNFSGEKVIPGNIIVRQKGTKFFPGDGTSMGKDFTIFATSKGSVSFKKKLGKQVVEVCA